MHPSPPSLPGSARYSHLVCVCEEKWGEGGEGMGGRHSQPEPFTGTQRRTMTLRWEVLIGTCNRMLLDVLPWEPKCDVLR